MQKSIFENIPTAQTHTHRHTTNVAQPQPPTDAHNAQRGAGERGITEPNRASATLKIFFSKIPKVGLRGWGRSNRDRVGIDLMYIVSGITVPRCRSLLLAK